MMVSHRTEGLRATAPIRVYLVDDHAVIRAALKSLLDRREGFEVVGQGADARRAIDEFAILRPDVVLLDITMPGLSGLDAIERIHKACPRTRVVMLTHHEEQTFVEQALRAGADGYLSKDSDATELALAIEAVYAGDPYVSPRVSSRLVSRLRASVGLPADTLDSGDDPAGSRLDALTNREREVFQLLALGRCNKEVARDLEMSLGTAKKHRENLQRKLDCHSAAELARLAIREGLLASA